MCFLKLYQSHGGYLSMSGYSLVLKAHSAMAWITSLAVSLVARQRLVRMKVEHIRKKLKHSQTILEDQDVCCLPWREDKPVDHGVAVGDVGLVFAVPEVELYAPAAGEQNLGWMAIVDGEDDNDDTVADENYVYGDENMLSSILEPTHLIIPV